MVREVQGVCRGEGGEGVFVSCRLGCGNVDHSYNEPNFGRNGALAVVLYLEGMIAARVLPGGMVGYDTAKKKGKRCWDNDKSTVCT